MSQPPFRDPDRLRFVDRVAINDFLDAVFGGIEWDNGMYAVFLGTKEDPAASGPASLKIPIEPATCDWKRRIMELCEENSQTGYSCFISPAVFSQPAAKRENLLFSTAVICDFDEGNPPQQLKDIEAAAGAATMVVASGGLTKDLHTKLHAYWLLDEPTDSHAQVEQIRGTFARIANSDGHLKTASQNIRIPGTCHCKGGKPNACAIMEYDPFVTYALADLAQVHPKESKPAPEIGFHEEAGIGKPTVDDVEGMDVRAGAVDAVTRHEGFSSVAGHHIHRANKGEITLDDAKLLATGWARAHMKPCWDEATLEYQWSCMEKKFGEEPPPPPAITHPTEENAFDWRKYVIDPFDETPPPPPVYTLADKPIATNGNIVYVSAHVKSGKSSAVAAMVASSFGQKDSDTLHFKSDNPDGKAVIYIDTEQARHDAIRLMNATMRRIGIRASTYPKWFYPLSVRGLSHGDMQRAIATICKEKHEDRGIHSLFIDGIADLVRDVNDAEECDTLVQGLERIVSEYSTTAVVVIHLNPGSEKERGHLGSEMQRKAETALKVKKEQGVSVIWTPFARGAEISESIAPRFTWSDEHNMHVSCTKSGKPLSGAADMDYNEMLSWMVEAIRIAAIAGYPYSTGGKNSGTGFYQRRHELHPFFEETHASYNSFDNHIKTLLQRGRIVTCTAKGYPKHTALDVPDGPLAMGNTGDLGEGAYQPPAWAEYRWDDQSGTILHIPGTTPGDQLGFRSGL